MANGQQTNFTEQASQARSYVFRLKEADGKLHAFRCVRNGQVVEWTGEFVLSWNPEYVTREWPARTTITQTPHAAWVDSFGAGLPKWTIRGGTGWSARLTSGIVGPNQLTDGYLSFHAFADLIEEYFRVNRERASAIALGEGGSGLGLLVLEFHDLWDDDAWIIEPEGFPNKDRSKEHLPIIHYEFRFTGIHDLRVRRVSGPPDPIGTALIGGKERWRALGLSIQTHQAVLNESVQTVADLERTEPGSTEQYTTPFSETYDVRVSESTDGLLARDSMSAQASNMADLVDQTESKALEAGPISSGMQSALATAHQASLDFAHDAAAGLRTNVSGCKSLWDVALDSLSTGPNNGAGDAYILSIFTPGFVATEKSVAGASLSSLLTSPLADTSNIPVISSISEFVSSGIAPLSTVGEQILGVASGARGNIETGIQTVRNQVRVMRDQVRSLQEAANQLRVLSTAAQRLRRLRQDLIQYMCAVQSLLSFPYLFVRDLVQSLQGLLDLFRLSGCATSFPNLQGLSWEPNIPTTTIPIS